MSEEQSIPDDKAIYIFGGSLEECQSRARVFLKEDVVTEMEYDEEATQQIGGAFPVFVLRANMDDKELIQEIMEDIWEEALVLNGMSTDVAVVDLTQDTIVCPGCTTEISELTEEGECTECFLFLGFPPDEEEEEEEA